MTISLHLEQATKLLELFGGEDACVTVQETHGHSGHGLYAYFYDYPEEGSFYLGEAA